MENINKANNDTNIEKTKYIKMLCNEKSDIVLKTEFGTGRYKFVEFQELQGNVMLQFKLLKDSNS